MDIVRGTGPAGPDTSFGTNADLGAVADWFGSPYAVLRAPDSLATYAARMADDDFIGAPKKSVLIRSYVGEGQWIHVASQVLGTTSPQKLTWETAVDYVHSVAGSSLPWKGGPPPADVQDRLSLDRERSFDRTIRLSISDRSAEWPAFVEPDLVTDRAYAASGGQAGDLIVAVVGPVELLLSGQLSIGLS